LNENEKKDNEAYNSSDDETCFANLNVSAMTLFQIMTGGRLWSTIADDLAETYPGSPIILVAFVSIAIFAFGGMAIAILVQALASVQKDEFSFKSSPSSWAAAASTPCPAYDRQDFQRLERNVEQLSRTVDQLLGMQTALQKSLQQLAQQQMARSLMESISASTPEVKNTPLAIEKR
jgi:hypothetical protein